AGTEGPAVAISPRAKVTSNAVGIEVVCSARAVGFCRGRLTLAGIGSGTLSATAGRSTRVQVKISRTGLTRLTAAEQLRVRAIAIVRDQLGNSRKKARLVTVTALRRG